MIENRPPMVNERVLRLKRLKSGSVLKIVSIGTAFVFLPMGLFYGTLAFFGANTVTISGQSVTGWKGLVVALVLSPFFTAIFSLVAWVATYLGIRLFGFFSPIAIEYVPADEK